MGMALSLLAVNEADLRGVLESAPTNTKPRRRLFGLLPGKAAEPDTSAVDEYIDDLLESDLEQPNPAVDDLDKAWDVIRVALEILSETGSVDNAVVKSVTGSETAHGGPMGSFGWVPAAKVPTISRALKDTSVEAFERAVRSVPDDTYFADVRDDGEDYFTDNFEHLRRLYGYAASEGKAVICVIH